MKIKRSKKIALFTIIVSFIIILLLQTTNLAVATPTPSEEPPPPPTIQDSDLEGSWRNLSELDRLGQLASYSDREDFYNLDPYEIKNMGKILTCYDTGDTGTMTSLNDSRYPDSTFPVYVQRNGKNQNYPGAWNRTYYPGVFCASPQQHGAPRFTEPYEVIDISFNEVKRNGTSIYKIEDDELGNDLRLAAFCAYRSRQQDEDYGTAMGATKLNNPCTYMKVLRYLWLTKFINNRNLNFPGYAGNGEANPTQDMIDQVRAEFEQKLDEGKAAKARFVYFLDTQVTDNDARAIVYLLEKERGLKFTEDDISKMCSSTQQHNVLFAGKLVDRPTGNLLIIKKDMDNASAKELKSFRFKIKDSKGRYLKIKNGNAELSTADAFGNLSYVQDENSATTFVTDDNSQIYIKRLYTGRYEVIELAQKNPTGKNVYYAEDPSDPVDSDKTSLNTTRTYTCNVTVEEEQTAKVNAENRRKYVDIGGTVWQDGITDNKGTDNNNKYDGGEPDHVISNINVKLMEGNRVIDVKPTVNGQYKFEKLEIDKLKDYHIEFEYNGLHYQAVKTGDDNNRFTSKAIEENRDGFNSRFNTIEHNVAKDSSGNTSVQLGYTFNNHTSKLNLTGEYPNSSYWRCGTHGQPENPITIKDSIFTIKAKIDNLDRYVKKIREESIDYLDLLNLGIYEREQPDLAIAKDLKSIRLSINGHNHIYEYASRFDDEKLTSEALGDTDGFNVGVKYQDNSPWATQKYTRGIYKSDYSWTNPEGGGKDTLEVYFIYQIKVKNTSSTLVSTVNEIVDYYDARYENFIKCGTQYSNGALANSSNTNVRVYTNGSYYKAEIDTRGVFNNIKAGETRDLYMELQLTQQRVSEILSVAQEDADGNITKQTGPEADLNNITEIVSYSSSKDGRIYAGVDEDSNPGTLPSPENADNPENESVYEDDTDIAPPVRLELAVRRKIKGIVFEDETTTKSFDGNNDHLTREGDRIYTPGEKPISNVKVTLYKASGANKSEIAKLCDQSGNFYDGVVYTREDGTFEIPGLIPDDYIVEYEWGDVDKKSGKSDIYKRSVQRYKATVYDDSNYKNNDYWYENESPRRSDAYDNYETRKEIDKEIQDIYYGYEKDVKLSTMESDTAKFKIEVEDAGYQQQTKFKIDESNGQSIIHEINNIDFGIAQRPKQSVSLDKDIDTIKLTLLDGEERISAKYDPKTNLFKGIYGLMNPPSGANTKSPKGMIWAELDNELVQGSTLEINYNLSLKNTSEYDFANEEFYKKGIASGNYNNVIKVAAKSINDYMDEEWGHKTNSDNWDEITIKQLGSEPDTDVQYRVAPEVLNSEGIKNKIILNTTDLPAEEVEPGVQQTVSQVNAIKVLTSGKDIDLDNEAEIIHVYKTGGGLLETEKDGMEIPGNYIPKAKGEQITGNSEADDTMAQNFTLTPNTGANMNFIIPVMIAIASLAVIGLGITFIERKILK